MFKNILIYFLSHQKSIPTNLKYLIFSLFTTYPEFQRKHFPHMMSISPKIGKSLTMAKLRMHGKRVIREIGIMVEHVQAGNDEELMAKIKHVSISLSNSEAKSQLKCIIFIFNAK